MGTSIRRTEAIVSAVSGALVAMAWTYLMLVIGGRDRGARWFVGFAFSFVAGALDLIPAAFGRPIFTTTGGLLAMAAVVGLVVGGTSGAVGTYDWRRRGALHFVADLTWGLTGGTLAALVQLINMGIRRDFPARETARHDVLRYPNGIRPKGNFTMTVGPVMSNCQELPGAPLYQHERVHVFQNRVFGPTYMPTYLAWLLAFGAFGGIVGLWSKSMSKRAEAIGYYSNPWEVWAYAKHESEAKAEVRLFQNALAWPVSKVVLIASVYFSAVAVAAVLLVIAVV